MGSPSLAVSIQPIQGLRFPQVSQVATKVLTTFQSGHGYTAGTGATATLNDATNQIMGTQCLSWVTKGAGAQAAIKNFSVTSFTAATSSIRIRVKLTGIAYLTGLSLYVGDTNLTNYYLWTLQGVTADQTGGLFQDGEWRTLVFNFSDAAATGSPNKAAITNIQIATYDNSTGIVSAVIQSIELVEDATAAYPNGVISISCDDSYGSFMTLGKAELDKYCYPAACYTIVGYLGTANRTTLAELQAAQDKQGWEIGAHAFALATHATKLPGLSIDSMESDFEAQLKWAKRNGIQMDGIAYPGGSHNAAVVASTRKYFSYGRTVISKPRETPAPGDNYRLRANSTVGGVGGTTVSSITTASTGLIDVCKANKGWLHLVFHSITAGAAATADECRASDLATILAAINTAGVPVVTPRNVLKRSQGIMQ